MGASASGGSPGGRRPRPDSRKPAAGVRIARRVAGYQLDLAETLLRQAPDCRLGHSAFVPGLLAPADQDAPFVALAGKQDGIAGTSATDSLRDALAPVFDAGVVFPFLPADFIGTGGDLAQDGHRVFFARIFVGEDRVVAQPSGDLAHPGTLFAIAVAGAPEDGDQLALRDRPEFPQDLLEALRRVGVIDDHGERLAKVDPLHAPADAAEPLETVANLIKRQAHRHPRRSRRQRIG